MGAGPRRRGGVGATPTSRANIGQTMSHQLECPFGTPMAERPRRSPASSVSAMTITGNYETVRYLLFLDAGAAVCSAESTRANWDMSAQAPATTACDFCVRRSLDRRVHRAERSPLMPVGRAAASRTIACPTTLSLPLPTPRRGRHRSRRSPSASGLFGMTLRTIEATVVAMLDSTRSPAGYFGSSSRRRWGSPRRAHPGQHRRRGRRDARGTAHDAHRLAGHGARDRDHRSSSSALRCA